MRLILLVGALVLLFCSFGSAVQVSTQENNGFEFKGLQKYFPVEVKNFWRNVTFEEMEVLTRAYMAMFVDLLSYQENMAVEKPHLVAKFKDFVRKNSPGLVEKIEELDKKLAAKYERLAPQTKETLKQIYKEAKKLDSAKDMTEVMRIIQTVIHMSRQAPPQVKKDVKRNFPNMFQLARDPSFKKAMDMLVSKPPEQLSLNIHSVQINLQNYFDDMLEMNLNYDSKKPDISRTWNVAPQTCKNPDHHHFGPHRHEHKLVPVDKIGYEIRDGAHTGHRAGHGHKHHDHRKHKYVGEKTRGHRRRNFYHVAKKTDSKN